MNYLITMSVAVVFMVIAFVLWGASSGRVYLYKICAATFAASAIAMTFAAGMQYGLTYFV
jgi:hypothetical protein